MSAENGHGGLRPGGVGDSTFVRPPGIGPGTSTNAVAYDWRKQETLRYLLEGYTCKEIAKLVGVAYGTIMSYTRDPKWRTEAAQLKSDLLGKIDEEFVAAHRNKSEIMEEITMAALEEMKTMIADKTLHPSVKAKLIDSALDRDPELSKTKKFDITERKFTLSGEDLLHAVAAAQEIEERKAEKEAAVLEAEVVANNPGNDPRND